mmetsp:Transcript_9901/g.18657  ORF Transcript_9901/g.18657 Transcript_9901/m.18657 type:complete len:402 (+) Transcript_9901:2023-3228(+)|eukprot:CAMPEP_0203746706 /NCGR_PEP_ID=MMETSP0098-20131031/2069_1 /ASSEMBLY_ACC=CAM_ASM_000208 /TAXON_ID=96639 /ORGANISM=" , Strain NY0313808BC1" /LENGTH=401 /DNA_ID=CAMNT_0050634897 /DNA_START=2793 /DNA_END=3998 /DNA_ORIENTATION=-
MEARKCEGNSHLSAGNLVAAVRAYSEGIKLAESADKKEVDDVLHLLYGNRSVARLKNNDPKGALEDAQVCLKMKPMWGKAYGRKGNALCALGDYEQALKIYEEGVAIDRSNKVLIEGKEFCLKKLAENKHKPEPKAQGSPAPEKTEEDDDPMASFLKQVAAIESKVTSTETTVEKDDKPAIVIDHDLETQGWTSSNQTDRILGRNFKFINANPFAVFGIKNEDATNEDIKKRFHKLSTLVHPDKNSDTRAQDAFDQVKRAYTKLKDDNARALIVEVIKQTRSRVLQTRSRLIEKGLTQEELVQRNGTEANAVEAAVKEEFAKRELRRLKAEQNERNYNKRQKESEEGELNYWKNVKQFETTFREGREDRAKNWQGFAKGKNGKRKHKGKHTSHTEKKKKNV